MFLLCICFDCQKTSLISLMPFGQLHRLLCGVLWNSGDWVNKWLSGYMTDNFCLLSLKISLSHLITEKIRCLKATCDIVGCLMCRTSSQFCWKYIGCDSWLDCSLCWFSCLFLAVVIALSPGKDDWEGGYNLHNHHSNIYQSVNLRTFSWESG